MSFWRPRRKAGMSLLCPTFRACGPKVKPATRRSPTSKRPSPGTSKQPHRTKGSHQHYFHPDRSALITVPVHTGSLKRGLLAGILKDAGVSREEFLELL